MSLTEPSPREKGIPLSHLMRERMYGQGAYKELHNAKQSVNWKLEVVDGEVKKVPYNAGRGYKASSNKPQTWGYLPQAIKRLALGTMYGSLENSDFYPLGCRQDNVLVLQKRSEEYNGQEAPFLVGLRMLLQTDGR